MFNSPNKSVGVINGVPDFPADGNDYVFQGDNTWKVLPPPPGKNLIINGNLTVDQRGVYTEYVADRWKIVDANNMTQIIEDVNFEPSTEYTLSWEGGTPQQITSPASGHWTLPNIPRTARKIQLEKGDEATEFEFEDYGTTLAKCGRYCQDIPLYGNAFPTNNTSGTLYASYPPMRTTPVAVSGTLTWQGGGASNTHSFPNPLVYDHFNGYSVVSGSVVFATTGAITSGPGRAVKINLKLDAEL